MRSTFVCAVAMLATSALLGCGGGAPPAPSARTAPYALGATAPPPAHYTAPYALNPSGPHAPALSTRAHR